MTVEKDGSMDEKLLELAFMLKDSMPELDLRSILKKMRDPTIWQCYILHDDSDSSVLLGGCIVR